jgi:hypothetical protein
MSALKKFSGVWVPIAFSSIVAAPLTAAYGQQNASVSVNGALLIRGSGTPQGGGTASTLAAAKVFSEPAATGESLLFNGAAPGAAETTSIQNLMKQAGAIPYITGNNPDMTRKKIQAAVKALSGDVRTDTAPGAAGKNTFALVKKVDGMTSKVGPLESTGNPVAESASATARQNLRNKTWRFTNSSVTNIEKTNDVARPMAVALTYNRDPIGMVWNNPGSRSLTVDLSKVSFQVNTQGAGSTGIGFLALDGKYFDGTTNVNTSESLASPLFSLLLPVASFDGAPPAVLTDAFSLNATGSITDSVGDSGKTDVEKGLLGDLTVTSDGMVEFLRPFSFTVTVPGSAAQSLLFLDESTLAEASAVPEPSALILAGMACTILITAEALKRRARRIGTGVEPAFGRTC